MLKALLQTTKLGGADFSRQEVKDSKIENLSEKPETEPVNPEDQPTDLPIDNTEEKKYNVNVNVLEKDKWASHVNRIEDMIRECMEVGNELTAEDIDCDQQAQTTTVVDLETQEIKFKGFECLGLLMIVDFAKFDKYLDLFMSGVERERSE
jgi:hypothetical protein